MGCYPTASFLCPPSSSAAALWLPGNSHSLEECHVNIQQQVTLLAGSHSEMTLSPPPVPHSRRPTDGERGSHKSGQRRAYAQWIVTTRLLYHLHDPAELISRMQRIYPRALSNCHTSARALDFHQDAIANLLRFRARGLFVFLYDVRGRIVTFWHGF